MQAGRAKRVKTFGGTIVIFLLSHYNREKNGSESPAPARRKMPLGAETIQEEKRWAISLFRSKS